MGTVNPTPPWNQPPRSVKAYYVANGEWHVMHIKVKHRGGSNLIAGHWTICQMYDDVNGWMYTDGTVNALTQYDPVELRQLFTHKGYLQGIGDIYFELLLSAKPHLT